MQILLLPIIIIAWILINIGKLPQLLIRTIKNTPDLGVLINQSRFKDRVRAVLRYSFFRGEKTTKRHTPVMAQVNPVVLEPVIAVDLHSKSSNWLNTLPFFQRKRGRPRKYSILIKYKRDLAVFSKRVFPTPVKLGLTIIVLGLGLFFYSLMLVDLTHDMPNPTKLSQASGPITSEIYDRKGRLLYKFYEGRNRTLVQLDQLPTHLINATIAIEDKNFYTHPGFDIFGMVRAANVYYNSQEIQGGSTITQQLIKNTLLTPDRNWQRKLKEIALAFWAERIYSKDEILQMYFNEVAYGGPAWGIEAAAETYFKKPAKDLTLAESAYLAGLTASPTTYSPYGVNPELGKQRQGAVLGRMVEDGYITKAEADQAYQEKLTIAPPQQTIKAAHFVMYVRSILSEKYGERTVSQGGLKIYTSLDLDLQAMAEKVVEEEVAKLGYLNVSNGAAMITNPKTGEILAMVGSKNYFSKDIDGNFNVSTALRQPGSSIKPITYATAFKQGYTPANILLDTPVTFKNSWESYSPVNYDGKYRGPVTIRTSLASSLNTTAVKTLAIVGIPNMVQTARDMGITTFNDPERFGLSLTLGGGEVTLLDMMTVYNTLANYGVRNDPRPVIKVVDSTGTVVEDNSLSTGTQVLSEGIAYMITDILADNNARAIAFGTNSQLLIPGHQVAAKTGTTDNKKDNWAFGYTPEFTVGAWVGNNDGAFMDQRLASGVTGATPIWNRIITNLVSEYGSTAFVRPSEVITAVVDGKSDLAISGQVTKSVVGQAKRQIKDEQKPGEAKESITFTDPFSTYIPADAGAR